MRLRERSPITLPTVLLSFLLLGIVAYAHAGEGAMSMRTNAIARKKQNRLPPYEKDGLRVEYQIVLPKVIRNAIKAHDPNFKIWMQSDYPVKRLRTYPFSLQSTPSAIIGDFNGDGRSDAALAGRNEHGTVVLAVLSQYATSYQVIPIFDNPTVFDWLRKQGGGIPQVAFNILYFQPKGKTFDLSESATRRLTLKRDSIEDARLNIHSLKWFSSSLYWWDEKENKFLENALIK